MRRQNKADRCCSVIFILDCDHIQCKLKLITLMGLGNIGIKLKTKHAMYQILYTKGYLCQQA